jgi:hypothetical protein
MLTRGGAHEAPGPSATSTRTLCLAEAGDVGAVGALGVDGAAVEPEVVGRGLGEAEGRRIYQ